MPVSQHAACTQQRGQLKQRAAAHVKPTIATPVCPPDSLRSSPSNAFGPSFGTDFSLPGAKAVYAPAARARRSTRAAANVDGAALAAGAEGGAAAALALAAGGALEPFAGDLPLEAWPFWPFMGSASSESDAASVAFPALALPAALVGVGRCGAGLLLGRAGGMGTDAWTPKASFRATKPEGSRSADLLQPNVNSVSK